MATVYQARDLKHHRAVAVKVLRPDLFDSSGRERFLREIEIAAALQHPNILPLHDSGAAEGLLYYVMPYVEGESLRDRLDREKQLPVDEALRIAREVAEALGYAHGHGIVHRDIKPENVLLTAGHALVADFGIARAISEAGGPQLTERGIAVGTPAYMSPEQASGREVVDARSDLYSLGCVVYEMLAGEPPFTGRTAQAIMARHMQERPPSLRVVRPTVSLQVQKAIEAALAKVPADRFATAAQFVAALEAARSGRPMWRRRFVWAATAGALVLAVVLWRLVVAAPQWLDPQRVVVYPLVMSGVGEQDTSLAESVTDALREALNSTGYVKGVDGWHLLDQRQRSNLRALSPERAGSMARRKHAGSYVGGQILLGDSVRLFLQFEDLTADSSLSRQLVFGPGVGAWAMGVRAARELLPFLIPAGRAVDLASLGDQSPAATASFLQGDRAYRRGRFREALDHYRDAVRADSGFALAALKGAQSASWNLRYSEANQLIRAAHAHEARLPPRYTHWARGFEAHLRFRADSAVTHFRHALELDPEWPEAWTGLGEVYTHLLPRDSPLDSLAAAAFAEAHRLDPNFAPVLYHLLEIALRKGDARTAARLMQQFRNGQPDSVELVATELMLECVQRGPRGVDWRSATLRSPGFVTEAARSLTVGGLHQPDCARAAWDAILTYDTTSPPSRVSFRWGALLGMQSVLLAQGRYREVEGLLEADTVFDAKLHGQLYILDAIAGADAGIDLRATAAASRLREAYRTAPKDMSSLTLWYLGIWEAHRGRGRAAEARVIGDTLAARAARSGDPEEGLLAQSVAARAALARGDSAEALKRLQALIPNAGRAALTWEPWQSLGGERLLLAELRLARSEFAEAIHIGRNFDAPGPVPYVLYLPASLALRLRAARALGDEWLAQRARTRLEALGRGDLAKASP